MAKTIQDLAKKTLQNLRLIDAFEDPSPEDFQNAATAYESKYSELFFSEIAYWPIDEIDDKAFLSIARIVSAEIAPSYGKQIPVEYDDTSGEQVGMGVKGLRDLKRLVARDRSGMPTQAIFF